MNCLEQAIDDLWPVPGAVTSVNMFKQQYVGGSQAAWLKWAVVPLLAFLLAGLITRKLVPARQAVESQPFEQTVAASLKKLDSGDRAGALDGLVRAGKMAPGGMREQIALVGKFQALGEHKLAAEAMERSLRAAPKEQQSARSYAGLCEILLNHGDIDNAERVLAGDLMARWPDALETAYLQGAVALRGAIGNDDIAAAAKQLQKCVALDPDHVPSKLQLGIAYRRLGELDSAEPLLRGVLEKRPFDPIVLQQLGEALRERGQTAEATKMLDEHKRVSELQERRTQLESQYSLKQFQPADLLELGRIYGRLGEFAKAASTLRVYLRHKPADADVNVTVPGLRELAQYCLKIDDKEGARLASESADALGTARTP